MYRALPRVRRRALRQNQKTAVWKLRKGRSAGVNNNLSKGDSYFIAQRLDGEYTVVGPFSKFWFSDAYRRSWGPYTSRENAQMALDMLRAQWRKGK